jgi:hypothetical protein
MLAAARRRIASIGRAWPAKKAAERHSLLDLMLSSEG